VSIVSKTCADPPGLRVTLVSLNETVGPLATIGETADERVTVPEKPFWLVRVAMVVIVPLAIVAKKPA
jgi:hypothetical protein